MTGHESDKKRIAEIKEWLGEIIRRPIPVPPAPKDCIILTEQHKSEEKDGDNA